MNLDLVAPEPDPPFERVVIGDVRDPAEYTPLRPATPYGASRLAGERVLDDWARRGESRAAPVVRPSAVFGPWHYANVYALLKQIDAGRYLRVGDGRNCKSLVYVRNRVDAAVFLLQREPGAAFEVWNYVDKPDLNSAEIAALTGRHIVVSRQRIRKLASDQIRFAARRIREFGFVPRYTLVEGIDEMVRWYV